MRRRLLARRRRPEADRPTGDRAGLLMRYRAVTAIWSNPCVTNRGADRWRVVASLGVVSAVGRRVRWPSLSRATAVRPPRARGELDRQRADRQRDTDPDLNRVGELRLKTYGYGASPTGADYQPDVVVVGGGAAAIRSASSNGLVWTIAKKAPGVDKLKVGSVMLLTSIATGRVAAIHDDGDTRVVTLAPVNLTDVIRNGAIDVDQALPGSAVSYQLIPDLVGAKSVPQAGDLPSANISSSVYHRSRSPRNRPRYAARRCRKQRAARCRSRRTPVSSSRSATGR